MSERRLSKRGFTLRLEQDADPEHANPRDCDNAGTMVCFARRYLLGDHERHYDLPEGEYYSFDSENNPVPDAVDYGWSVYGKGKFNEPERAVAFVQAVEARGGVVLPLYLYDHSGITMRTSDFGDRWDSGQIGWIYATAQKIKEEWGDAPDAKKNATECLMAEVKEYDKFIRGEVYGYVIEKDGEQVDSCWGFIGDEPAWEEGESAFNHTVLEDEKAEAEEAAYEDERLRSELDQHLTFIGAH